MTHSFSTHTHTTDTHESCMLPKLNSNKLYTRYKCIWDVSIVYGISLQPIVE